MNINNIKGTYGGYFNNLSMMNSETKATYSSKNSVERSLEFKDTIDISTSRRYLSGINDIGGMMLDKGTASHTTLYVDRGSFDQILNYSINNPEYKWDEMGMDDEKRWVVINGQRFECPLTEEEKEACRRAKKGLLEILNESEKEREKHKLKSKPEIQGSVKLSFDKNNKIKLDGDGSLQSNDKIKNLIKNDKVMKMLTDIMNMNGGQGINLSL